MDCRNIKTPQDLKRLNISELEEVCSSVRARIIESVEKNGGHLASNLGAVEFTVALHRVFDCPKDRIIFDVGHQSYAHKILTGRNDDFDALRSNGGISGFPQPEESEYDPFYAGHASTSLSVALGFAEAARSRGEQRNTIAVIGDGALTGGMAYEALNAIGSEQLPVVIVLNDNNMSISKNVGAMSKYLAKLRVSKKYARVKSELKRAVSIIPFFGDGALHLMKKGTNLFKRVFLSGKMFEEMGIKYYGPFDGHNVGELINVFLQAKNKDCPVIVHILTDKGHGLKSASCDPEHSHGISSAKLCSGGADFSDVLGDFLIDSAAHDDRVIAVTAAMAIGTGLEKFSEVYKNRFKDVGIAEEHAVTYCAALAAGGLKPYFAVYSTFLQRGFDQLVHDVCIGSYPVVFCIDRAGAVGADGVTHQGLFDLSYLLPLPNMTVMCPTDGNEFRAMLEFSLGFDMPLAIRYPKSYSVNRVHKKIEYGKWEETVCAQSNVYVLCAGGRALDIAEKACETQKVNVINTRFVKPLDCEMLDKINKSGNIVITIEDNIKIGGFGASVTMYLNERGLKCKLAVLAHGDVFIDDRSVESALSKSGLTAENLIKVIKSLE